MATRQIQKLFIANLPWTVGHQELRKYFSEFGHITLARVVFDKNTGLSRGYGFIMYGNQNGYTNALNKQVHQLEGNIINVQPATQQ